MHLKSIKEKGRPESWETIKDDGDGKMNSNVLVLLIL